MHTGRGKRERKTDVHTHEKRENVNKKRWGR